MKQNTSEDVKNQDTDDVNLNPLTRISEDLHELIFQHLTGKDVLRLSLVSPQWHDFTSNSKNCMKLIKLKVVWLHNISTHSKTERFELIQKSLRKYQYFYFYCNSNAIVIEECMNILKAHAKSVVSIVSIDMISDVKVMNNIILPNLQSLSVREIIHKRYNAPNIVLLQASKQLTSIKLDISANEHVIECLKNKNLTEIDISYHMIENIFKNDVSGIFNFKLKTFCANTGIMNRRTEENFIKFLISQANNLKSLQLFRVNCNVMNTIISSMKALIHLQYQSLQDEVIVLDLNENKNIIFMEIRSEYKFERIKRVLEATPNLKELFVERITKELVEFLAYTMKMLKIVEYFFEDEVGVKQNYDLKLSLSVLDINKTIKFIPKTH